MKSCELKDAGFLAVRVDQLALWSCFGATAGSRTVEIRVQDVALQRLDKNSKGADHTHVLDNERNRSTILKIATEKIGRGEIEPGAGDIDIVRITYADVAQHLGSEPSTRAAPTSS